jgi:hypothetical protein
MHVLPQRYKGKRDRTTHPTTNGLVTSRGLLLGKGHEDGKLVNAIWHSGIVGTHIDQ